MPNHDISALVPATVRCIFGKTSDGVPQDAPHVVDVTLTSLALPEYPTGYTGHDGYKVFKSSCVAVFTTAGGGTATNDTEIDALATQIATDYYLWQLGKSDINYADIVPYVPHGYADSIEWTWKGDSTDDDGMVSTRVQRRPWRDLQGTLEHHSDTGKAIKECCDGLWIYNGGIIINAPVEYTGTTEITYGSDTTITFTNTTLTGDSITFTLTDSTTTFTNQTETYNTSTITYDTTTETYTDSTITYGGNTNITYQTGITTTWASTSTPTFNTISYFNDDLYLSSTSTIFIDGEEINLVPPTTTKVITTNENNLDIEECYLLILTGTATANITGFANVLQREVFLICNETTKTITFTHADASSTAGNRFDCPNDVDLEVPAGGRLTAAYDLTNSVIRLNKPAPLGNTFETTITTTTNDLDVEKASTVVLQGTTAADITGFANAIRDTPFIIVNESSQTLTFKHASGSSTLGNRFDCPSGADLAVAAGSRIMGQYDTYNESIKLTNLGGSTSYSFTISDGSTTQTIANSDTITFTGGSGVDLTVSATDTLTADLDFNGLTAAAPDTSADYFAFYDATDSTHKKALLSAIGGVATGGTNHLAVFKIPENLWTAAAGSETITLNADIGNSVYVERIFFRVPEAYSGGGISTFTITLEITDGTSSVFSPGVSGHTVSDDYQVTSPSPVDGIFAFGTAVQVKASAASVGGDVVDATLGEVWFVVDYKTLTES